MMLDKDYTKTVKVIPEKAYFSIWKRNEKTSLGKVSPTLFRAHKYP